MTARAPHPGPSLASGRPSPRLRGEGAGAGGLTADRAAALTLTPVSRETLARLDRFVEVFLAWQRRTNLVAPSTVPQLWTRHIADSLQLFTSPQYPQLDRCRLGWRVSRAGHCLCARFPTRNERSPCGSQRKKSSLPARSTARDGSSRAGASRADGRIHQTLCRRGGRCLRTRGIAAQVIARS